jgi:hypothetical protein
MHRNRWKNLVLLPAALVGVSCIIPAKSQTAPAHTTFAPKDRAAFLEKHCADCHNDESHRGG